MSTQFAATTPQPDAVRRGNPPGDIVIDIDPVASGQPGPVAVSHVADFYHRYPGELVTFYTRVELLEPTADLTLRVSIPNGLTLGDYHADPKLKQAMPFVEVTSSGRQLVWNLPGKQPAAVSYEFEAQARVAPARWKINFESVAVVANETGDTVAEEVATVGIEPKGSYLQHLPELYEEDELMGRFLMLFESFWAPMDTQIDSIANYFDPRLTPAAFLPWLASWLDLELDESWPEEKVRQLIRWAIALHRSRGTRWGLLKYLELYTGCAAKIVEHRADNFVLGDEARLGPAIALGDETDRNMPHTFTVTLHLPPVETDSAQERKRLEEVRRQGIETIIRRQQPAHTVYTLQLEPLETTAPETATVTPPAQIGQNEIAAQSAIWFKLDE